MQRSDRVTAARLTMVDDPVRQLVLLKHEKDVLVCLAPGGAVGVRSLLLGALGPGADRLEQRFGLVALASCMAPTDKSAGGCGM